MMQDQVHLDFYWSLKIFPRLCLFDGLQLLISEKVPQGYAHLIGYYYLIGKSIRIRVLHIGGQALLEVLR